MKSTLVTLAPLLLLGCVSIEKHATTEELLGAAQGGLAQSENYFAQRVTGLNTRSEILDALGPPLREQESKTTTRESGVASHEYESTAYWERQRDEENSESIEISFDENGRPIKYKTAEKYSKVTKYF